MKKFVLFITFVLAGTLCHGQDTVDEDSLKAAFIFHFIGFVEWGDSLTEYYVCVPDNPALQTAIKNSLQGKMVKNRKVTVVDRAESCHILISEQAPASDTTLTIGPLDGGALLEFRTVGEKLKFAVNLERIKKFKPKISSQLLGLAILEKGP